MGADCCSNANFKSDNLIDLAPPSISTSDQIEAWELTLPFQRATMKAYMTCLNQAYEDSGADQTVTFDALAVNFNSNAWKAIRNMDSKLCKFLKKHAKSDEDFGLGP